MRFKGALCAHTSHMHTLSIKRCKVVGAKRWLFPGSKMRFIGTLCVHRASYTHTHNQATCTILKVEKMDALKM
jgi:hypothetical protein